MKILFDQGTPVPLRQFLTDHTVKTAYEESWSALSNGDLLTEAENAGYQLLVTTDHNLRYQQNLRERQIAIVVLLTTSWPRIRPKAQNILEVINALSSGGYAEIPF